MKKQLKQEQPCVLHLVPNCVWCRLDADRYSDKDFERLNAQRREQFESGEKFNQIASTAAKHKDMTGHRTLLQLGLHERAQAHEAASQVGNAGSNPNTRVDGRCDHRCKHSNNTRNTAGSALPSIRTCACRSSM